MKRESDSHKGENGKIAVVGGSEFIHGAPIINLLAAEATGVDTLSLCLPACHAEVAKNATTNVFVHPFRKDDLSADETEDILELLATIDCAVIGSGISRDSASVKALMTILGVCSCPLVLDATALQPQTLELVRGKNAVLTPHLAELERMEVDADDLQTQAGENGVVICLKGQTDRVAGPGGKYKEISGGNAGLTVGGTGDALAGVIAGVIAQGIPAFEATVMGCTIMKRAATLLYADKGYAFTARDVITQIPHLLHTY